MPEQTIAVEMPYTAPKSNKAREWFTSLIPYLATYYYLEIIYIMISLNFLFGKTFSAITGLILTLLLTIHIIFLYYRKKPNRVIHLFIIDIHIAMTAAFSINSLMHGFIGSNSPNLPGWAYIIDIVILIIRAGIVVLELAILFHLTNEDVKKTYG
ncbi:MAG: hypothetical protein GY754_04630 [bacterium]|nr:hypothetical protein [bacterium]